jgi:hypothetical protein
MASTALAAAVTEDVQWYTAGGTLLSGSETVGPSGELVTEIAGTKLRLTANGVECLSCVIENSGGVAVGHGKVRLTGVTVTQPATCAVEGGAVTTNATNVKPDYMIGSSSFVKFEPTEGTSFATLKLIKGTGSCALSGTYSVTGSAFAKADNTTGTFSVSQIFSTSGAINAEAGGELLLGSKKVEVTGAIPISMTGARAGTTFATK